MEAPGAGAETGRSAEGSLCGGAQLMHMTTPRGDKQTMWTAKARALWREKHLWLASMSSGKLTPIPCCLPSALMLRHGNVWFRQ